MGTASYGVDGRAEDLWNVATLNRFNAIRTLKTAALTLIALAATVVPCEANAQSPPNCNPATISATWYDNGTLLQVVIGGVNNATSVLVPTWSVANGQDDISWYPAIDHGYGTWIADIRPPPPAQVGTYSSHVYMSNANFAAVWCGAVDTWRPQAQSPTCTSYSAEWKSGGALLRVYINGVANATAVNVPTWSVANGQDDLPNPWQSALNYGNGNWIADITPLTQENGTYAIHIYMNSVSQANVWCGQIIIDRQL